jgi:hypothetical protein
MFSKAKSTIVFVCNKLVSMFIRHTYKEHLKLFVIVLGVSLLLCLLLSVLLSFNFITLSSEPVGIITWFSESLMSFLDIEKVKYIGITYLIALIVHSLAEEMIDCQTVRDQIPKEKLINELRVNTRAVLITMTNGLSLIFKLFIGVALVLSTFIYFGNADFTESLELSLKDIFGFIGMAVGFEIALFVILKWVVLPYEAPLESKAEELNISNVKISSNEIKVENKITS